MLMAARGGRKLSAQHGTNERYPEIHAAKDKDHTHGSNDKRYCPFQFQSNVDADANPEPAHQEHGRESAETKEEHEAGALYWIG